MNDLWEYDPSSNNWRWLKGNSQVDQNSTFGTQGVASAVNTPGARQNSVGWQSGGKLYLFGGLGKTGNSTANLNEMWEFDLAIGSWSWLRSITIHIQYGIYGIQGVAAVDNMPGARVNAITWQSGDKLYLFGGRGFSETDYGLLNDLWEYNPVTKNWRWLKGSKIGGQSGVYGVQSVTNGNNTPGGRSSAAAWQIGGKLYLFGGQGHGASGQGTLNDVWEYDPATNNWRWLKGSDVPDKSGVYGTQNQAAATNTPGSREGAATF